MYSHLIFTTALNRIGSVISPILLQRENDLPKGTKLLKYRAQTHLPLNPKILITGQHHLVGRWECGQLKGVSICLAAWVCSFPFGAHRARDWKDLKCPDFWWMELKFLLYAGAHPPISESIPRSRGSVRLSVRLWASWRQGPGPWRLKQDLTQRKIQRIRAAIHEFMTLI